MALKLSKKNSKVQKVVKKARRSKSVKVTVGANNSNQPEQVTLPNTNYTEAVGRRKVATARVRMYESGNDFYVNNLPVAQYFSSVPNAKKYVSQPLEVIGAKDNFTISVQVSGSGQTAQADAVIHGIARALVKHDPENRNLLKPHGFLTRDARMKETRKIGTGGKARRKRQSPKR